MTSDHDKFATVAARELRQLWDTSIGLASDVVVPLMIVTIVAGMWFAIWILRGGLSRSSLRTLNTRQPPGGPEDRA